MDALGARFIDTKRPQSAPSRGKDSIFCSDMLSSDGYIGQSFCASPLINFSVSDPIVIKIAGDLISRPIHDSCKNFEMFLEIFKNLKSSSAPKTILEQHGATRRLECSENL